MHSKEGADLCMECFGLRPAAQLSTAHSDLRPSQRVNRRIPPRSPPVSGDCTADDSRGSPSPLNQRNKERGNDMSDWNKDVVRVWPYPQSTGAYASSLESQTAASLGRGTARTATVSLGEFGHDARTCGQTTASIVRQAHTEEEAAIGFIGPSYVAGGVDFSRTSKIDNTSELETDVRVRQGDKHTDRKAAAADRHERQAAGAATGLEATAGDLLVLICSFIQPNDIGRLSSVTPVMFDDSVWQQLHLALYGSPSQRLGRRLPFAHASRIQLQSDFPVHHSRLLAIRQHHWLGRSTHRENRTARALFVLETLAREDRILREQETALRRSRAHSRRKHNTDRASAMRDLSLAKRASTEEMLPHRTVRVCRDLLRSSIVEVMRWTPRKEAHVKRHFAMLDFLHTGVDMKSNNTCSDKRMVMVHMKAAVERHAYAPGGRPKIPQASFYRDRWYHGGGRKALDRTRPPVPSLTGLFNDGSFS